MEAQSCRNATTLDGFDSDDFVLARRGGMEYLRTVGSTVGALTLDLDQGNVFDVTLGGNVQFTFTGGLAGRAQSFTLILRNTSSRTITWPASVRWPAATAPTLTSGNKVDIFTFITVDAGTKWYGFVAGQNFAS